MDHLSKKVCKLASVGHSGHLRPRGTCQCPPAVRSPSPDAGVSPWRGDSDRPGWKDGRPTAMRLASYLQGIHQFIRSISLKTYFLRLEGNYNVGSLFKWQQREAQKQSSCPCASTQWGGNGRLKGAVHWNHHGFFYSLHLTTRWTQIFQGLLGLLLGHSSYQLTSLCAWDCDLSTHNICTAPKPRTSTKEHLLAVKICANWNCLPTLIFTTRPTIGNWILPSFLRWFLCHVFREMQWKPESQSRVQQTNFLHGFIPCNCSISGSFNRVHIQTPGSKPNCCCSCYPTCHVTPLTTWWLLVRVIALQERIGVQGIHGFTRNPIFSNIHSSINRTKNRSTNHLLNWILQLQTSKIPLAWTIWFVAWNPIRFGLSHSVAPLGHPNWLRSQVLTQHTLAPRTNRLSANTSHVDK